MIVRWTIAILTGAAIAAMVGLLALLVSPVAPEMWAIIFAIIALPFGVMLGIIIFVVPRRQATLPHESDTAERMLMNKALAGTATDIVFVVGLGLAVVSVSRQELPTQLLLIGLLLVAFASTATRYSVARARAVRA